MDISDEQIKGEEELPKEVGEDIIDPFFIKGNSMRIISYKKINKLYAIKSNNKQHHIRECERRLSQINNDSCKRNTIFEQRAALMREGHLGECWRCRKIYHKKFFKRYRVNNIIRFETTCIKCKRERLPERTIDSMCSELYRRSYSRAKKKNFEFDITYEYIRALYDSQKGLCAISRKPMTRFYFNPEDLKQAEANDPKSLKSYSPFNMSLDRIDSSKGYIMGNVRLVTVQVNMALSQNTDDDFLEMCRSVIQHVYDLQSIDLVLPIVPAGWDFPKYSAECEEEIPNGDNSDDGSKGNE